MRNLLPTLRLLFVLAVGVAGGVAMSHYYAVDEAIFEVIEDQLLPSLQDAAQVALDVLNADSQS